MKHGSKGAFWVGFDLGGTKMMATVFDDGLKPLARKRKKTKAQAGVEAGLERIAQIIDGALDEAGVSKDKLAGIGVGSPGPLDLNRGVILDTPNLGWKDAPLKDSLEEAFGCPVVVLNDVDAGVYGEYVLGAAKKARCAVGLFPGTGIGGGCVYDGSLIRGRVHSCMEIGHLPVQPGGPLCGCGRRGCLETLASRLAISAAAAAAAYRGEAPYLREKAGTDLSNIRSGVIAESIAAGDKTVEQIVRRGAEWLGYGVAALVNLMSPDVVVLGGGLVEAMPDLFRDEVAKSAANHVMPSFENTYKIAVAKLGDDATVTGAAAWAREVLKDKGSKAQ